MTDLTTLPSGIKLGEVTPGMLIRQNSRGHIVVTLEHYADPDKRDPRWLEAARANAADEATFRQEYLLDWTVSTTENVYPEFTLRRADIVRPSPGLLRDQPVYRGWDTGGRHPAVLWGQWSPDQKVFWALRELNPAGIGAHALRDLTMFLSGELAAGDLPPRALSELTKIEADKRYPPPPWFPPGTRFVDYAGHEIRNASSLVPEESPERTFQQVLFARNIIVTMWKGDVADRVNVLKYLMRPRAGGSFGFYVDPACWLLIEGLAAGICYQRGTPLNPRPNKIHKDGKYEHIHDALGYILVNLVDPRDPLPEPKAAPKPADHHTRMLRDTRLGEVEEAFYEARGLWG